METERRVHLVRRIAVALLAMTFLLMVVGSWVKATGSGLSCPDWPQCYGQWLPPFPSQENGGVDPATGEPVLYTQAQVLYEWAHRALASAVGVVFLVLLALAWPDRRWIRRVETHPRLAWAGPPGAIVAAWIFLAGFAYLALPADHALRASAGDLRNLLPVLVAGSLLAWFLVGPLNPVIRKPALRTDLHPGLRRAPLYAAWVLLAQILLGGVTVLGKNAAPLTTAHLATATLYLLLIAWTVAFAVLRPVPEVPMDLPPEPERIVETVFPGEERPEPAEDAAGV